MRDPSGRGERSSTPEPESKPYEPEPESHGGVTPDLETIHAVAHGEPVADATHTLSGAELEPPAAPEPPDRDTDVSAALQTIISELSRIKAAYGEDTAILLGERAITTMRKASA